MESLSTQLGEDTVSGRIFYLMVLWLVEFPMAKKRKKKSQRVSRDQKRRMRLGQILFAIMGLMMIVTMVIQLVS